MKLFLPVLLLSGAAFAQEGETPGKIALNALKKYDSNSDGEISKNENPSAEFFKKYDGDGDLKVTAQEIRDYETGARKKEQMMMPKRKRYFGGLDDFGDHDVNADGKLGRRELDSYVADSIDRNRDGFVDDEEYAYIDKTPRGDGLQAVEIENFEKLDTNADAKLDIAEFLLPAIYAKALDRNGDGGVSKEEMIDNVVEAWGGVPGPNPDIVMRRMDSNRDGELDRKEFDAKDRLWNSINRRSDADDVTISREELDYYFDRVRELRQKANGFLTRYDFNGDGKVTRDEFDGPDGAFDRCDTNGDSLITRADGVE